MIFPVCSRAGDHHGSGSAGKTLHPGRHLYLRPVRHRVVPHRGQVRANTHTHTHTDFCRCDVPLSASLHSRQRCLSLVNLSFRLGCLVNSLVPPNPNGAISLAAMLVYSCGPIIGCAFCLLLPETSGVPLPDSVEECDRQPRLRPPGVSALRWAR